MTDDSPARQQATVPVFDQIRAAVLPGNHVVARFPGVLLVVRATAGSTDGAADTGAGNAVPVLLQICRDVTAAAPRSPGRQLARRLTGWLAQTEDAPGFGTVAATEDGLAIFLYGEVTAWTQDIELAGSTAAFTVDRLMDWPQHDLMLAVDGVVVPEAGGPDAAGPDWFGLQRGVVTGAGATLHVGERSSWLAADPADVGAPPAPAGAIVEATEVDLNKSPQAPAGQAEPVPAAPPAVSDQIFGVDPDEPPRAPLPVPAAAAAAGPRAVTPPPPAAPVRAPAPPTGFLPPAPPPTEGVTVLGYRCSRGHLNDPRVSFCAHCGIRMDQLTGVLVKGRRPPLGLIVLDTGSTFVLDDDYLLGRDPENDPGVQNGQLRGLRLDDNSGTLSRAHLEIRLQGWDVAVVDRGSANGTYVAAHGQQGWSAVVPHQPFVLGAGAQVGVGRRTFTFESPHGRL